MTFVCRPGCYWVGKASVRNWKQFALQQAGGSLPPSSPPGKYRRFRTTSRDFSTLKMVFLMFAAYMQERLLWKQSLEKKKKWWEKIKTKAHTNVWDGTSQFYFALGCNTQAGMLAEAVSGIFWTSEPAGRLSVVINKCAALWAAWVPLRRKFAHMRKFKIHKMR